MLVTGSKPSKIICNGCTFYLYHNETLDYAASMQWELNLQLGVDSVSVACK